MSCDAPTSGPRLIEFTDPLIERADVLDVALYLIVDGRVPIEGAGYRPVKSYNKFCDITDEHLNLWADVASFLNKSDCTRPA